MCRCLDDGNSWTAHGQRPHPKSAPAGGPAKGRVKSNKSTPFLDSSYSKELRNNLRCKFIRHFRYIRYNWNRNQASQRESDPDSDQIPRCLGIEHLLSQTACSSDPCKQFHVATTIDRALPYESYRCTKRRCRRKSGVELETCSP